MDTVTLSDKMLRTCASPCCDLCVTPLKLNSSPTAPPLRHQYMSPYRWMEQRHLRRVSRQRPQNVRELLPEQLKLHHLPLKEVLWMGQQVHVWSCRLRREDQSHRQDITNTEYNHSIRVKSMALADAHSLAGDMSIQRNAEIIAYTLLEVTFDLRMGMSLAQTNKATWIRCSQVLIELQAPSARYKRRRRGPNAQDAPWTKTQSKRPRTSRCTYLTNGCIPGITMNFPISSTWTCKFANFSRRHRHADAW